MNKETLRSLFENAKDWVFIAGELIRKQLKNPIEIDTKSNPNDLVTSVDKAVEKYFVEQINKYYPTHRVFGEEGYGDEILSLEGVIWIIDPIDGTMNFVHQKRNFAISIGIYVDGIGEVGLIYDVMKDELYSALRGEGVYKNDVKLSRLTNVCLENAIIGMNHHWLCPNRLVDEKIMQKLIKSVRGARTYGSAALELAYVAEGISDAYLSMRLSPWDIAAGLVLINEVGAKSSNIDGATLDLLHKQSIFISNPAIYDRILKGFLKKARK